MHKALIYTILRHAYNFNEEDAKKELKMKLEQYKREEFEDSKISHRNNMNNKIEDFIR
jgi:hypothetical protein